jgi:Mg-chelatase subunit ChlD
MDEEGRDGKKTQSVRLDFAKRELHRAMDAIAPNAQFNLVTFNGDDKADAWSKDLVPATEKNRERFKKYVDGLEAVGGTNLWSGLESALKIKSLVYGNRYTVTIDELFVLSDGAPTVGDVQDPIEILRIVQECNKFANVRINTFFISSATPPEGRQAEPRMSITPQELMRRMAEQNGGKFREL